MSIRPKFSAWIGTLLLLAAYACQDAPSPLPTTPTAPAFSGSGDRPAPQAPPSGHSSHFDDGQLTEALTTPSAGSAVAAIRYIGDHQQVAVHSTPLGNFPREGSSYVIVSSGYAADPTGTSAIGYGVCQSDPEFDTLCDVGGLEVDLAIPIGASFVELDYQYFSWDYNPFEDPFRVFLIAGGTATRVALSTLTSEFGSKGDVAFQLGPVVRHVRIDVSAHQGQTVTLRLLASDRYDQIYDAGALVGNLHFDGVNSAPQFVDPTPACGSTAEAFANTPLTFEVKAADPDQGASVSLSVSGLPEGAISPLPAAGNPVSSVFSWQPTKEQVNQSATITYTAQDDQKQQTTCGFVVAVTNRVPVAKISAPAVVVVGKQFQLDGSGSTDEDGHELQYSWNLDGEEGVDATTPVVEHTFLTTGSRTVKLTVSDGFGGVHSTTTAIEVVNTPPVANPGGPYTGVVTKPLQFDGSGSSDPDDHAISFAWDFDGDGVVDATDASPTYTYTTAGSKTATLTVTDEFGLSHTASTPVTVKHLIEVTVTPPASSASIASTSSAAGLLVAVTNAQTGEFQVKLTDAQGKASFELLSEQGVLITARRLAIQVDPNDPGSRDNLSQLRVWPFSSDESQLPTTHEALGPFVGVVYNGSTHRLNTDGYVHAVRNPLPLRSGEGKREVTLSFEAGATVECTLLHPDGSPARFPGGKKLYGVQPFTPEQEQYLFPRIFASDLPRGLAYTFSTVTSGDQCSLPGVPAGTSVLSTAPVVIEGEELTYRTATKIGSTQETVQLVVGPAPVLRFVYYFTSEPFGDALGPVDSGGLITGGWTPSDTELVVSSDFQGLGHYRLEIWYSNPGATPPPADVDAVATCESNVCRLLPRNPKVPTGTTAKGVYTFQRGTAKGTLYWRVPTTAGEAWFRISTSGRSEANPLGAALTLDATEIFRVVKRNGTGNSHDVANP